MSFNHSQSQSHRPYYLLDKNSLRQMMNKKTVKIMTSSEMFQNNFEDVNCAETDDQEIERVKSLDIWNIPKTSRQRGPDISLTTSHSAKQFHSKKIKDPLDFPHIKTELVNRILADPQDESEPSGPSMRFKTNDNEDASKLPLLNYENNPFKKKEISKHGYNEELVHDIIMKKIKEQIKLEDAAKLSLTQLKLHVKAIAEDAVAHFKSLKGILTAQHIQNYVAQTLDMFRDSNKQDFPEPKPPSADVKNWSQEEKPIINHELSGMALMRELNVHTKESKDLRELGISIDQAIFKSKKQKAIWEEKLKQIKREIKNLVEEIELASQHVHSNKNYSRRRSAVSDPQRIEDFMQLKKMRDEKKAEEEQIIRKLNDIDIKQDRLATESKRTVLARREAKAKKLYSKIQLKNLYYAMLKDEAALMQNSNSGKGCIWALKALWNMGEDVKESAFPAFLDHKAAEFALKYAKAQFNLETFCAQNHLTEALSPHKTSRLKATFLSPLTARDKLLIPQSAETNVSDAAGTILELDMEALPPRQFTKSLNHLRSEYQEKTNALKRTNLKAKRQIFFGNPLSKDKSASYRWEEVDPKEAETDIYYGSFDSPAEFDAIKKHRSEIKPPSLLKQNVSTSNSQAPFEKAVELTNKLDEMKKEGVEKLTEHYMHKLVDERTKLEVHKIFRFIFGKEEGEFLFHKLVMEKKYNDEKMLIKVKKAQPKKITPDATPGLKHNKSSSDAHRHASASLVRSANTPSTKSKFLIPL